MPTLQEILNMSDETEKVATEQASVPAESAREEMEKIARELDIFNEVFPEDASVGETKTAEEEKVAAYQEELGGRAFDYFALRFDQRMSKIAGEIMSSADMEAAQGIMQPTERPPQAVPTNQDPMLDKLPPNPVKGTPYTVQAGAEHGAQGQVGHEEQKVAMQLAVRKHFLKAAMGQ